MKNYESPKVEIIGPKGGSTTTGIPIALPVVVVAAAAVNIAVWNSNWGWNHNYWPE